MGLSTEEKERFEDRFHVRLLNSYGMTETVSAVTCVPLYGEQLSEQEVADCCKTQLSSYKVPELVEFVKEFKRTATGKIRKSYLLTNKSSTP